MKKPIKWKLAAALALPLAVGAAAAFISKDGYGIYKLLYKPLLSPPGWVFPVVWTLLYLLMGYASYLIYSSEVSAPRKQRALRLYAGQLVLNFAWPLLFFGQGMYLAAFMLLILLILAVFLCMSFFDCISARAGKCMLVYLLWLFYAAYLNLGVVLLN